MKVLESTHKGKKPWKMVSDLSPPLGFLLNSLSSAQEWVLCRPLRNTTSLEHTSSQSIRLPGRNYTNASIRIVQSRSVPIRSRGLTRKPMTRSGTLARTRPAFGRSPCSFLRLDKAPSSYEDRAPTHMPISGVQRQDFQPAEKPESALEDTRREGDRWVFGFWGECSQ